MPAPSPNPPTATSLSRATTSQSQAETRSPASRAGHSGKKTRSSASASSSRAKPSTFSSPHSSTETAQSPEPPSSQHANPPNEPAPQPEANPQNLARTKLDTLYAQVLERRAANPNPKLNEAFRTAGLDEHMLAAHYKLALDILAIKMAQDESVDKATIDYLKECRSVLDPPRAASSSSNSDGAPVSVTLVHSVDRPVRPGFDSQHDPPPMNFGEDDPRPGFPVL